MRRLCSTFNYPHHLYRHRHYTICNFTARLHPRIEMTTFLGAICNLATHPAKLHEAAGAKSSKFRCPVKSVLHSTEVTFTQAYMVLTVTLPVHSDICGFDPSSWKYTCADRMGTRSTALESNIKHKTSNMVYKFVSIIDQSSHCCSSTTGPFF